MADIAETEENKGHGGFWLGMVLGGLLGGALAFFSTADEETKKDLLKKGKALVKNFGELKEEIGEKGTEIKENLAEKIEEAKEEIPQAVQEAVENVQKTANQAQKKARTFFLKRGKPLAKK